MLRVCGAHGAASLAAIKILVAIRKYKSYYLWPAAWAAAWRILSGVRPMCHHAQKWHLYAQMFGLSVRRRAL